MVKEKGFSILLFFMVIIAIELISLGGVFAYQYYSKIPNSQLPISNESSNPQNSDTKTAGWEAYSGYGIFFKYPKEMGQPTVNQLSTKVSISFNQGAIEFDVGAYYNQELGRNMTLDEVVNSAVMHPNIINITRKNIIIDGKSGVELDYRDKISGGGTTEIYIPMDENGNILMAYEYGRAVANTGGVGLFQIMPTLKFIPQPNQTAGPALSGVEGWKTYTNTQYGFEFKYPPKGSAKTIYPASENIMTLPIAEEGMNTNLDGKVLRVVIVPKNNGPTCTGPNYYYTVNGSTTIIIDGIQFSKGNGGEGAAGHGYEYEDYTTEKDNNCITMSFVISSYNDLQIPVYNGGKAFVQYDFSKETPVFNQIMSTFKFTEKNIACKKENESCGYSFGRPIGDCCEGLTCEVESNIPDAGAFCKKISN